MATKFQKIKLGNTTYDIDLPSDATPSIKTLTTSSTITAKSSITGTSFNVSSDIRIKENIKEFTPKGSILDLPVVEFDYKDNKEHHIGCIAQDLQEICPEIVHENCNGYLHIEESKLVYLLLLEVKKLREEVDKLKEN